MTFGYSDTQTARLLLATLSQSTSVTVKSSASVDRMLSPLLLRFRLNARFRHLRHAAWGSLPLSRLYVFGKTAFSTSCSAAVDCSIITAAALARNLLRGTKCKHTAQIERNAALWESFASTGPGFDSKDPHTVRSSPERPKD